jgi:prepilin-type N-terminal cleavage/methylation domain-containing protein
MQTRRGVTLIELLMTIVISGIALFSLAPVLIAEGQLFRKGKRQTEAQRDAQMVVRAMARVARQSTSYDFANFPGFARLGLVDPFGGGGCFIGFMGGPFAGQFWQRPTCDSPNTTVLIDGVRSRVVGFTVTPVVENPDRLVHVRLQVSHRLRTTDPLQEDEVLETDFFLRNGT